MKSRQNDVAIVICVSFFGLQNRPSSLRRINVDYLSVFVWMDVEQHEENMRNENSTRNRYVLVCDLQMTVMSRKYRHVLKNSNFISNFKLLTFPNMRLIHKKPSKRVH